MISLTGNENFKEWDDDLAKTLGMYGLSNYHDILKGLEGEQLGSYDTPDTMLCTRGFLLHLISDSVTPVCAQLTDAGWDSKKMDQDPKALYNLIVNLFFDPSATERCGYIAYLVDELSKGPKATELSEWKFHIESVKFHLSNEGAPINDTLATWLVLWGLEDPYPDFQRSLLRAQYDGKPMWNQLMSRIDAKVTHDEAL